jgi:hypothetical protein
MKLFTKDIDKRLFAQYPKGSDLESQVAVTKIFNPYGRGRWFLLNSDPQDPDYIWAIVQMGDVVEIGSVSRSELESIRVSQFRLPLERDLGFSMVNAGDLYRGLLQGKFYKKGGVVDLVKFKEEYDENEDNNMHSENVVLLAKTFGSDSDIRDAKTILAKHEAIGSMPSDLYKQRQSLSDKLWKKYQEAKANKMAHGGMVAGRWYIDNSGKEFRYIGESQGKLLFNDGEKIVEKEEDDFEEKPKERKLFGIFEDGGFVEKTDEELKSMNDDELFAYLDAKAAYMKQYSRPLSSFKAKNFAANATAVQFKNEGTSKLDANFPNLSKINKQAEEDYQEGLKKLVEKRKGKMAKGGLTEHGLKVGDKIVTDQFWDKNIVVENTKTNKKAIVDLESGKRKESMAMGGKLVGKQKNLDVNKNGKLDAEDFKMLRKGKMAMGGKVKFKDKVASIQKKLLANKKVPKAVQKDYGKTFTKSEAKESAQRIVGAMVKKGMK